MQKKREISEYREKLDKTLSSPELNDHESLKSLLRNQLCSSSECNENILDKRTSDVSKLLSMLRSVSMTDHQNSKLTNDASSSSSSHGDWKIKQDLEDCRVMYREGLEGSPLHTLLVEGYMDSPIEDCLCVSWESALYKNWWPQFVFPPFKILQGTCLLKVRIGEQVCLVRMKVPWPLSERELIVHYFLFEYFKDDLVIILLNSISDLDSIGVSTKDIIPESTSAVRIDLVGGFALQKVTSQKSFVRVIGELDIKLDFVPPSLMNFISRQIVGKGFKLYKKAAGSVAKFDEDFSRALADPLYTNIRQAMYSTEEEETLENSEVNSNSDTKNKHKSDEDASENEHVSCKRTIPEIEESVYSEEVNVNTKTNGGIRRQFCISAEVEQALGTLDRAINMVRNIKPVQKDEELPPKKAEDEIKQVSLLEIPQRSHSQDFSTSEITQESSYFSQEDKRENETRQEDGILNKDKNESLRRRHKTHFFAFRS
ncbi:unnamed protein product [Eruca vesicaria subsp. sativa]|uniref:Polyketide cyclase/dehydrase and lipid transport superfamily protein n=1 Tax=Eruca vesicaria subsp. sativa TaxID=29727 RepID=A0ABC8K6X5_ERUVS|nr:unnamed protein product [Eruca vesicaria subsp. sativa]